MRRGPRGYSMRRGWAKKKVSKIPFSITYVTDKSRVLISTFAITCNLVAISLKNAIKISFY